MVLERIEATQFIINRGGHLALRLAAAIWRHDLPEQRVVCMPTAAVAHRPTNLFRQGLQFTQKRFHRLLSQPRSFNRRI